MPKKNLPTTINYRIIKKDSSDEDSYENSYDSSDFSESDTYSSEGGDKYKYTSIVESIYKKPKNGSKQDNMTREEIMEKLKGYRALRTMQDKKYLLKLKPFKVWIRYFNTQTKEFRIGGLLKLVDPDLKYIMLVNTSKNLTWSVQLKNNIIFVPKNIEQKEREKEQERENERKKELIKDKLYKLYKAGKLAKR